MREMNKLTLSKRNQEKLQTRYPKILDEINNSTEQTNVEIIRAKDNNLSMIITTKEKKYYINSKYKPLDEAKSWVSGLLPIKKYGLIIVFGFGLGYRIKELLKCIGESEQILIIEPSIKVFSTVMENIDIGDLISDNRVTLFIGKEEIEYKKIISDSINWTNAHNVVSTQIPNYSKVFDNEYRAFDKAFTRSHVMGMSNYLTINGSGIQWQKNLFLNAQYFMNSVNIDSLNDEFLNIPAVIVSAGPSLNKNVELLKEVKNKAVIISVDTALSLLLKHDICPDFVVSIDGTKGNFKKFKNIEYSNIPLVYFPLVYPKILDKHRGDKFIFTSKQYKIKISSILYEHMEKAGELIASGSVAISAISLAHKIGANPIIMVGQDLAYTNNLTHALGIPTCQKDAFKQTENPIPIEDIYGNMVYTNSSMYLFLQDIQGIIAADIDSRIYIDATEGGAKIEGTKIMKLREVIDVYVKNDIEVEEKITSIISKNKTKKSNSSNLQKIAYELYELKEELQKIVDMCEKACSKLEEMMLIYEENMQIENYEKIKEIVTDVDDVQAYLKEKRYIIDSIPYALKTVLIKATNEIGEFDANNINEFQGRDMKEILCNINFYKAIREIICEVLPSVDEGIDKLSKFKKTKSAIPSI
ncbi:MAG: DUF115 domain-containing protein [Clostridia bacterium]|nr:DUF115 domain-containing protein [Clostridia bacterium]